MDSDNGQDVLYKLRHSAAHVMAQAVLEIYPAAKIAIGPPIDTGFYYDFDLGKEENGKLRTFSPGDLEEIEKRMRRIIAGRHPFVYRQVSADEARSLFADQPYKLELIEGLEKGGLDEYGNRAQREAADFSIYQQDTFDGSVPWSAHVSTRRRFKQDAFKLMSIAGAYWRGDENNKMLQRIYGTAWESKQATEEYLTVGRSQEA
jgi:threonyl-tRNA synthetase